jgi:hypothetical protein
MRTMVAQEAWRSPYLWWVRGGGYTISRGADLVNCNCLDRAWMGERLIILISNELATLRV